MDALPLPERLLQQSARKAGAGRPSQSSLESRFSKVAAERVYPGRRGRVSRLHVSELLAREVKCAEDAEDVQAVLSALPTNEAGLFSWRELQEALRTVAATYGEAGEETPRGSGASLEPPSRVSPEPVSRPSSELSAAHEGDLHEAPEESSGEARSAEGDEAESRRCAALTLLAERQAAALAALRSDREALESALGAAQRRFRAEMASRKAAEAVAATARLALEEEQARLREARATYAQLLGGAEGAAEVAARLEAARSRLAALRSELADQRAAAEDARSELPGCAQRTRMACALERQAVREAGAGREEAARRSLRAATAQLASLRAAQQRELDRLQAGAEEASACCEAALGEAEARRRELDGLTEALGGLCERLYVGSLSVAAAAGGAVAAGVAAAHDAAAARRKAEAAAAARLLPLHFPGAVPRQQAQGAAAALQWPSASRVARGGGQAAASGSDGEGGGGGSSTRSLPLPQRKPAAGTPPQRKSLPRWASGSANSVAHRPRRRQTSPEPRPQ